MAYQTNRYYTPQRRGRLGSKPPKTPSTRFKRGFIKFVLAIVIIIAAYVTLSQLVSTVQNHFRQIEQQKITDNLNTAIQPIIASHQNVKISVALYDPTVNKLRTYGYTESFQAASTAKVIAALAYYHLVEQGKLNLSHTLGAFTAEYQIQQMINQSNNESWELLVQEMGRPYLQQYASSIGSDYQVAGNTVSAGSMAKTLSELQVGKLLNLTHTAELLSYMQNTNEEDLIPTGLPEGVVAYHKYGLLSGALHDAGIIQKANVSYGFVIYTQSSDDSDDTARAQLIRDITKAVSTTVFE